MEAVPLDDRGLLLSDGLFETLLWTRGGLVLGPAHAERMIRGAGVLGLPPPKPEHFIAEAEAAVAAAALTDTRAAVRVTFTAGSGGRGLDRPELTHPRLFAAAAPSPFSAAPAVLTISSIRRNAASPASRLKTLAYLDNVLARREARDAGADEAVMLNTGGHVAGAAAANLFWIEGQTLATPALEAGCLDGIMRGAVLTAAAGLGIDVREDLSNPDALLGAGAVFLTNSLIGIRPVRALGDVAYRPHPITQALAAALTAVT